MTPPSRGPTGPRDPNEEYADRLRDALRAEAEQVTPAGDGLLHIRDRVNQRSSAMRWYRPVAAIAGVALIAGAVVGGVALLRDDDNDTLKTNPPAAGTSTTPTPTPTATPNKTQAPATRTYTSPVYYVHDTGQSIRLYREFHQLTGPSAIEVAVNAALAGNADDDDYLSLWPAGSHVMKHVVKQGSTAIVDLNAAAGGQFNGGSEGAHLAVQQLVWTATGADPSVNRVQILVNGKKSDLWGSEDISNPVARDPQIDVLGPVWVLAPTQGQSVSTPVTLAGTASVFEATVSIDLMRNGQLVKRTFTTATQGAPGRGNWKKKVVLVPGTYEVRAYESSAKDGSPQFVDTKTFTVK